jgi:4-amino-4-deoxychorismate lyase
MSLLFETISIRDGLKENLPWHQERLEICYREIFGKRPDFNLSEVIRIPKEAQHGHFRCRIDFEREIKKIEFQPYISKEINTLRLITDNDINYHHKFTDRSQLDKLFEMRDECDDILIVKNGFITDSSFANIIFRDGKHWLTPAEPLLPGTCRARLLDLGYISEAKIRVTDLSLFKEAKLINALRGINDSNSIPIRNIRE